MLVASVQWIMTGEAMRRALKMGDRHPVHLTQVIKDHSVVVAMQVVAGFVKRSSGGSRMVGRVEEEVGAALVRFTNQFHNFFPGPGVIDVPDVQLCTEVRVITQYAFYQGTVRAVVFFCAVALRIGKVRLE